MILIGTSGSSKCDWQLVDGNKKILSLSTNGINPYFHTEDLIEVTLRTSSDLFKYIDQIEVVYFYGSACSSRKLKNIVERAFSRVFTNSHIYVNHDIVAAAFATYDGMPNITCLMGTGTNSCFFDGDIVRQEVPGIDYVLGDEGSGAYFGKKLLQAFLRKQLPKSILEDFESTYEITKHDILQNTYMKPFANVYLASFTKFIHKHKEDPFFKKILEEGILSFIEIYLECYPDHQDREINFVGSIPFFFQEALEDMMQRKGLKIGKIIKEPIDPLVNYHIAKHYKK